MMKPSSFVVAWVFYYLSSMSCITDTEDRAQNSCSRIGAAQSVPLKLTQTDRDAATPTRFNPIPYTTETNQLK